MFGTNIYILLGLQALGAIVFGAAIYYSTKYIVSTPRGNAYLKHSMLFHPNTISILRVPCALASFVLFFYGYYFTALMLYTLSVVSDGVDGIIARGCNLETKTGKWLDPLTDKLVYFIPLVYFSFFGSIPFLGVCIFIFIDSIGQFSRVLLDALKMETKANIFGKAKTVFVFLWIFSLMVFGHSFAETFTYINLFAIIGAIVGAILSIVCKFVSFPTIKG